MFFEFFPEHQAHTTFNVGNSSSSVIFRDDYRSHLIAANEPVEKFGLVKALAAYKYALLILVLILMLGIFMRKIALIGLSFSIVVLIVALAYYGVSPDKYFPNKCSFSAGFSCTDHLLRVNEVRVNLKNNLGTSVEITAMNLTKNDGTALACIPPAIGTFKSGEVKEYAWILCAAPTGLTEGKKVEVFLNIAYHASSSSSTFGRESQGQVYSTVQ